MVNGGLEWRRDINTCPQIDSSAGKTSSCVRHTSSDGMTDCGLTDLGVSDHLVSR
jgi:hypothetical protein